MENIYVFKKEKKLDNIFKNWLCPNFSSCPKNLSYPKFWGDCSPPRPPGPYAYEQRQSLVLERLENVPNAKAQVTQGETALCEWTKHE